jgi:hypothetical protein
MAEFTPFPVPIKSTDVPLVKHAGFDYVCSGCDVHVPDGLRIAETIKDGMVIGLRMTSGIEGPIIHQCGQVN